MPAKSAKQLRFMRAVAHDPEFAAKAGVSPAVGREFSSGLSSSGGIVKSGGYLESAKYGAPSMPRLRKARA